MNNKFSDLSTYMGSLNARLKGNAKMPKVVILKNHKAIYIPIPKVACTSLLIACAELLEMKEIPNISSVHSTYFPCVRKFGENSVYKDYFKFAFVRNPWDRLVSCYGNKIKKNQNFNDRWYRNGVSLGLAKYDGLFKAGMPFDEFANIIADIPDEDAEKHFRSQHTFLVDEKGDLLIDFVGRFEALDEGLDCIFKHLGVDYSKIPHEQKSPHRNYKSYYSESLKARIYERYQKDICLFGYSF